MTRTLLLPLSLRGLFLAAFCWAASGCVLYSPGYGPGVSGRAGPGDISFLWSFAGETNCARAGVSDVRVIVLDASGATILDQTEACVQNGLTLQRFAPGSHDVFLNALAVDGALLYSGSFSIDVAPNAVNDVGVVVLDPVDLASVGTGSLAFFWSFLYPNDQTALVDCGHAGVDLIDVTAIPTSPSAPSFHSTFRCSDAGVRVEPLFAGNWTLHVTAFGSFGGTSLPLFDSGNLSIDIAPNRELNLDTLPLHRVEQSFADLHVRWSLDQATCASEGIRDVEISFTRRGFRDPDSITTAPCNGGEAFNQTFVPGTYDVAIVAQGAARTFTGITTVDVPPNSETDATVQLFLAAR